MSKIRGNSGGWFENYETMKINSLVIFVSLRVKTEGKAFSEKVIALSNSAIRTTSLNLNFRLLAGWLAGNHGGAAN